MSFSDGFIKILDAICDKIGVVVDWSSNNILPQIQILITKIAHWEIATSCVWLVLGFVILTVSLLCYREFNKICSDPEKPSYDDSEMPYFVIGLIALALSGMIIVEQSIDIATAITFPEKTAIEFVQDLQNND